VHFFRAEESPAPVSRTGIPQYL